MRWLLEFSVLVPKFEMSITLEDATEIQSCAVMIEPAPLTMGIILWPLFYEDHSMSFVMQPLPGCGILVPNQGLNPWPLEWKHSLNLCSTREVPIIYIFEEPPYYFQSDHTISMLFCLFVFLTLLKYTQKNAQNTSGLSCSRYFGQELELPHFHQPSSFPFPSHSFLFPLHKSFNT